ncbi:MAG: hypothetical protein Q9165_001874 [Trypethelium subeluteriae]
MPAFVTPKVSLDPGMGSGIRTLPELVDFHGKNNPQHLFCIQAERNNHFVPVNYERLQRAIIRCQAWLQEDAIGLHAPIINADGQPEKCAPVAILMESHVGLAIYVLALMGLGVPVVLLSARLSAPAVRHLIRETGAKLAVVSPRLQPLASEAFPLAEDGKGSETEDAVTIRQAAGYETLLRDSESTDTDEPTRVAHPSHFVSEDDRQGFGFVAICLSLSIGKTICIPPPSMISTGASTASLIKEAGAKALFTVPSILEEIESLPEQKGHDVLRRLDFVGFGGGAPKASVGERLDAAGIRLVMQYGATETGPLTPFFIPAKGYDWRRLRLRSDTLEPLQVRLDQVDAGEDHQSDSGSERTYKYKLSLQPFGWEDRFELQDLIETRRDYSQDSNIGHLEFTIAGRTDDLICLATGEKVRPTILESLLRQHYGVKDATAFGEKQFELVVIVESAQVIEDNELQNFKASIWPAIEVAGREMDAHARITSSAAILVVPPGALPRSDKGTILRNMVAKKFGEEIADLYRNLEANVTAPPLDLSSSRTSIRALVTENVQWQAHDIDIVDDDDFFAWGMDSLQATKLRRLLRASIRATHAALGSEADHVLPVDKITDDFIYLHPSVSKLVQALIANHSMTNGVIHETEFIEQLVNKYTGRDDHKDQKKVVVLTGATGSLGSFFLEQLIKDNSVGRVICLNRPGKETPMEAQKLAMKLRGVLISDDMWIKVEVRQTSTAAPYLGLAESEYERLATEVTHIVHIAWPMNFKMGLQSYDASFRSLQNLIQLARKARFYQYDRKPRVLFISSVSTVGNYPVVKGESLVPETPVEDSAWTLELGYGKAKLVCEKIVQRTTEDYPEIEAGLVRVGQISGASNGYWNTNEHFVAICASSQKIGKFPDLHGTFSWIPVDAAAKALSEILFDHRPLQLVYHLENPVRQGWEEAVKLISRELNIPNSSIIPLQRWLDLVASAPGLDNPASSLINFLRNDFLKMSCGSMVLDTSSSRSVSSTMANMGPVEEHTIKAYLSYWSRIKLLK